MQHGVIHDGEVGWCEKNNNLRKKQTQQRSSLLYFHFLSHLLRCPPHQLSHSPPPQAFSVLPKG